VGVLIVLSLALITVSFRETDGGRLHSVQSGGATVLRPFEVGAERVARPFRDLYGWASSLFHAKSQNERLRAQVVDLRQRYIAAESALKENVRLRALADLRDTARYPGDFRQVNARVIATPPGQFQQQIVIAAGSEDGIAVHDPVVTADGLVGEVTKVVARGARVTLLTDPDSAVTAIGLTGASGQIRAGQGRDTLVFDQVTKNQVVNQGDIVVTAGTLGGRLRSLYPKDIPIGVVTSVGQTDVDPYMQIQVAPFVDFASLQFVAVLVSTRPRPTLP
jgi:rod shape-determining protein MreC